MCGGVEECDRSESIARPAILRFCVTRAPLARSSQLFSAYIAAAISRETWSSTGQWTVDRAGVAFLLLDAYILYLYSVVCSLGGWNVAPRLGCWDQATTRGRTGAHSVWPQRERDSERDFIYCIRPI